jgi:hypothetical protein
VNSVELIEAKVALLGQRVGSLEAWRTAQTPGLAEALAVWRSVAAQTSNLKPRTSNLELPRDLEGRKVLASELCRRGWSAARVAVLLGVVERTINRWIA